MMLGQRRRDRVTHEAPRCYFIGKYRSRELVGGSHEGTPFVGYPPHWNPAPLLHIEEISGTQIFESVSSTAEGEVEEIGHFAGKENRVIGVDEELKNLFIRHRLLPASWHLSHVHPHTTLLCVKFNPAIIANIAGGASPPYGVSSLQRTKYLWDYADTNGSSGRVHALENGDVRCNGRRPEGPTGVNMQANTRQSQKSSLKVEEQSQCATYHVVCHCCDGLEIISTSETWGLISARAHEAKHGHSVSMQEIDG